MRVAVLEQPTGKTGYGEVPVAKLWPDSTIVCIGSGPSLTQDDIDRCRGRARVIAIKDVAFDAPWADVLYGAGADAPRDTWWNRYGESLTFSGLRYSLDQRASEWSSVLKHGPMQGLSDDPGKLALGGHSGYQAINLAVHLGAKRIVLLGYDCQPTNGKDHYFGSHKHGSIGRQLPFGLFLAYFPSMVPALKKIGVEVVNATRETALEVFPRVSLKEALA